MSNAQAESKPFPGPLVAAVLTGVAWWTTYYWWAVVKDWTDPLMALAISMIVGYGVVGSLALSKVEQPWTDRTGLRSFSPYYIAHVVLFLPALPLGMELQALVRAVSGGAQAAGAYEWRHGFISTDSGFAVLKSLFLFVVLMPALVEWFFRGILQQGLVARLGRAGGLLLTSLFYALAVAGLYPGSRPGPVWVAVALTAFGWGTIFGVLRLSSGSLVPPTLLHAGHNAIWLLAFMSAESTPIPAFTAPGAHLPMPVLVPSLLLVAAGVVLMIVRRGRQKPEGPASRGRS